MKISPNFHRSEFELHIDLLLEKREAKIKGSKLEEKEIAKHYREQYRMILEKRKDGQTGFIDFISYQ